MHRAPYTSTISLPSSENYRHTRVSNCWLYNGPPGKSFLIFLEILYGIRLHQLEENPTSDSLCSLLVYLSPCLQISTMLLFFSFLGHRWYSNFLTSVTTGLCLTVLITRCVCCGCIMSGRLFRPLSILPHGTVFQHLGDLNDDMISRNLPLGSLSYSFYFLEVARNLNCAMQDRPSCNRLLVRVLGAQED